MNQVPPFHAIRGNKVFRNTGELSFETRPREAGTFPVTLLNWVQGETGSWYAKIINQHGRIEAVHQTLISRYNI